MNRAQTQQPMAPSDRKTLVNLAQASRDGVFPCPRLDWSPEQLLRMELALEVEGRRDLYEWLTGGKK